MPTDRLADIKERHDRAKMRGTPEEWSPVKHADIDYLLGEVERLRVAEAILRKCWTGDSHGIAYVDPWGGRIDSAFEATEQEALLLEALNPQPSTTTTTRDNDREERV